MSAPAAHLADLELALRSVVDAGAVVREDFGAHGAVTHKSPDQPLTDADLRVDRTLRERLGAARPDYGWLSEETKDDPDRLERVSVWIVDPIDGTRSFIEELPECMICVGLAEHGAAVVGVVHNPLTGELYWAVRDAGAYGALLAGGDCEPGEFGADALVACDSVDAILDGPWGRFTLMHAVNEEPDEVRLLASRWEMDQGELDAFPAEWRRIRRGSTAYKMAGIAAGVGDLYVSRGPKSEWDVCAAALVVTESGGWVSDLAGDAPKYNRRDVSMDGLIAARSRRLHERALDSVRAMPPLRRQSEQQEDDR